MIQLRVYGVYFYKYDFFYFQVLVLRSSGLSTIVCASENFLKKEKLSIVALSSQLESI